MSVGYPPRHALVKRVGSQFNRWSKPVKSRFRPRIRVFVSSTFSDLKAERNILQNKVFPSLEHYCLVRGFQFQANRPALACSRGGGPRPPHYANLLRRVAPLL